MAGQPPAFQFHIHDWRGSRAVQRMTFAERGMYLEMLIEQWDKGSLPDCPQACAELLGGTDAEWQEHWSVLRRKFVDRRHRPRPGETELPMAPDPSRRIINVRLEQYRRRVVALSKGRALAGKNGGLGKAKKRREIQASNCQDLPEQNLATSSFQVQVQDQAQAKVHVEAQAQVPIPLAEPTNARSKRPIFTGTRFVVFEWMLDDLRRLLGPQFEAFDLHAWFFDLNARAERDGLTVPQRDGGKWLQDQTLAEAIRRGFPVATLPSQGKTAGNVGAAARFVARGAR